MKTDYFRCRGCGVVKEFLFETDIPPMSDDPCEVCDSGMGWSRLFKPPSIGRGSSGEPFRSRRG